MASNYRARLSRPRRLNVFLVAATGMALISASCGGSGGSGGNGGSGGGSGGSGGVGDDPTVASVVIEPRTTLLSETGASRQLRATAYDANGDPVDAEITWRSSDTAKVTVDAAGMITSEDTIGSAHLTATADGVDSRPTRVFLVVPAINAVFVDDDQIGDLAAVDLDADYVLGFQYQVTVDGLDQAPTLGDILIGTGDQLVGGRAIDVVEQGDGVYLVTLELVGLDEMFDELVIDETFEFTAADVEIPDEVTDFYDVEEQSDGSWLFTAKPGVGPFTYDSGLPSPKGGSRADDDGTFMLGPFKCKGPIGFPVSLRIDPPTIDMSREWPELILHYDRATDGLQRLSIKGTVKGSLKITATLLNQISVKLECERTVWTVIVPLWGPISMFFGGQIPIGVGFEVAGKITVDNLTATVSAEASLTAEIGVQCVAGVCDGIATAQAERDGTVEMALPQGAQLLDDVRLEPSLAGFVFARLDFGTNLLPFNNWTFQILSAKASLTQAANLATVTHQTLDDEYASDYKLTVDIKLAPGEDIVDLAGRLGFALNSFEYTDGPHELGASPRSRPVSTEFKLVSVSTELAAFRRDDIVEFRVRLDEETVEYPFIGYNVEQVRIYRLVDGEGGKTAEFLNRELAEPGQTEFLISWFAREDGVIADDFYAAVSTRVPLPPAFDHLELGKAYVAGATVYLRPDGNSPDCNILWSFNAATRAQSALTSFCPSKEVTEIGLSWDAARIAFSETTEGPPVPDPDNPGTFFPVDYQEIFTVDSDGSNKQQLTEIEGHNDGPRAGSYYPAWSPDGTKIAYVHSACPHEAVDGVCDEVPGDWETTLNVMNADGSNVQTLFSVAYSAGAAGHAWSPDGGRIAYTTFPTQDGAFVAELYVINSNGGAATKLVSAAMTGGASVRWPDWSRDGTKIAFTDGARIGIINVDGSNLQWTPALAPGVGSLAWSPVGHEISFTGNVPNRLRRIDTTDLNNPRERTFFSHDPDGTSQQMVLVDWRDRR